MNTEMNKTEQELAEIENLVLRADPQTLVNTLAAKAARIKELEAGLREIDETLKGELPVTRIVKRIARRLLAETKAPRA